MGSRSRWSWLVFLTVALLLTSMAASGSQSKSLYWDRFDVNIQVLSNGDFIVEEVQAITFTSGSFHFGYRTIPLDRVEAISDVEVWEGQRQYEQGYGESPYTFTTYTDEGDLNIKWYFPYTSNTSHTFIIRYRVQGGLRYYDGGDQLYWKAVYSDRQFPVYESTVTVSLPPGARADPVAAYGTAASVQGQGTEQVVFTAQ